MGRGTDLFFFISLPENSVYIQNYPIYLHRLLYKNSFFIFKNNNRDCFKRPKNCQFNSTWQFWATWSLVSESFQCDDSSNDSYVSKEEVAIIEKIDPVLAKMGIVMYGVDTLVGDDGRRVLSEINTISIGGLPQIAQMEGKPLVKQATDLIWAYIINETKAKNVLTN